MVQWPEWWSWELELSAHLLKRMIDRQFNEADLRSMMQDARSYREAVEPGRWVIETQWSSEPWEVIVEPCEVEKVLVVVTAYRMG
jgi:hypothetical protein